MSKVTIKRIDRLDRSHWVPVQTPRGFQLVSRAIPYPERNWVVNATFKQSLEEAASLIEAGYAIRMGEPGAQRGDYIYPENLSIVRS